MHVVGASPLTAAASGYSRINPLTAALSTRGTMQIMQVMQVTQVTELVMWLGLEGRGGEETEKKNVREEKRKEREKTSIGRASVREDRVGEASARRP